MIIPFATIASFIIYFAASKRQVPFPYTLTIISLLISFVWMYFLTRMVINIIRVLAYTIGINLSIVVMIVLPIGNTLPVILDKLRMTALNLGDMALVGCFGSQIVRLSIGFFLTLFKSGIQLYVFVLVVVE